LAGEDAKLTDILVLGAGGMGSVAAKTAGSLAGVGKVTVADINIDAAAKVAAATQGRTLAVAIDLRNRNVLDAELQRHDIVLNATGPFYEFGPLVLERAIATGTHYADICDDWEPTLDMLGLGPAAAASGILAIIGMGASPGITNLLAVSAASALDRVDELITGWSIEGGEDEEFIDPAATPSAATIHWLQQLTGTIRQCEGGVMTDSRPLQRRVIRFPDFGDLPTWSVGHPEAVTLPRSHPALRHCSNVMVGDDSAFEVLQNVAKLVDTGGYSIRDAAGELGPAFAKTAPPAARSQPKPAIFAWARGLANGLPTVVGAQLTAAPPGGMGGVTGVPLALSIPFLIAAAGQGKRGVFTPDEVIEPQSFFAALAPYCGTAVSHGRTIVYQSSETLNG
jgi:saccharopine dehydrogenase-like NADP-dependent oxidoreductase